MRREVRPALGDAQLAADVGAVEGHRRSAHVQRLRDLVAGATLAHEVGDFLLATRQRCAAVARLRQPAAEGAHDLPEVRLQRIDLEPLGAVVERMAQAVQRRRDEVVHVADDAFLELSPLLFALLQQHLERGVALVEDRRLATQRPLRPAQRLLHELLLADVRSEQERPGLAGEARGDDAQQQMLGPPVDGALDLELRLRASGCVVDRVIVAATSGAKSSLTDEASISSRLRSKNSSACASASTYAPRGVDLHRRARQAEQHAPQLVGLALDGLGGALPRDVAQRADHVGGAAGAIGEQHALVAHRQPRAVGVLQPVVADEGTALEDGLGEGRHRRVVVVRMDALEPALDVTRERARRQSQQLVELLRERDRAALDVPVVEDAEADLQERLQPRVLDRDGGLRTRGRAA